MTVYIVIYSCDISLKEYICGVFTSFEAAQIFIQREVGLSHGNYQRDMDMYSVEEWTVND